MHELPRHRARESGRRAMPLPWLCMIRRDLQNALHEGFDAKTARDQCSLVVSCVVPWLPSAQGTDTHHRRSHGSEATMKYGNNGTSAQSSSCVLRALVEAVAKQPVLFGSFERRSSRQFTLPELQVTRGRATPQNPVRFPESLRGSCVVDLGNAVQPPSATNNQFEALSLYSKNSFSRVHDLRSFEIVIFQFGNCNFVVQFQFCIFHIVHGVNHSRC